MKREVRFRTMRFPMGVYLSQPTGQTLKEMLGTLRSLALALRIPVRLEGASSRGFSPECEFYALQNGRGIWVTYPQGWQEVLREPTRAMA